MAKTIPPTKAAASRSKAAAAKPATGLNAPAKATASDTVLLAACARFTKAHARKDQRNKTGCQPKVMSGVVGNWLGAIDDVIEAGPARSIAGLRAKAVVARAALRDRVGEQRCGAFTKVACEEERVLDSLLADLIGGPWGDPPPGNVRARQATRQGAVQ